MTFNIERCEAKSESVQSISPLKKFGSFRSFRSILRFSADFNLLIELATASFHTYSRMGFFKRGVLGASALTIPTFMALFLVAYFFGIFGMQSFRSGTKREEVVDRAESGDWEQARRPGQFHQKGCETVEDYVEDGKYGSPTENAWRQMKWGLPPAKCRVNGHLIERLDPDYNYRRGVALGFTDDLDDKTHVEQWFLGTKVDFNQRKRRVYIDLGAYIFNSSVLWFQERYPCDFTEVHAFEVDSDLFRLPEGFDEESNWRVPNGQGGFTKLAGRNGLMPTWMVKRIHTYTKFVGVIDDEENNSINLTRFIKDELKLTEDDVVVVKMDIEGAEWAILQSWMEDLDMAKIVDELWVEVHYYHPDNNWGLHKDRTRDEATRLLAELRFKGFYVHYWD